MGFFVSQICVICIQAALAVLFQFFGMFLGNTEFHGRRNRILILAFTSLFVSGPSLLILVTERYNINRELSKEAGIRFIEEVALWTFTTAVFCRPLSQFFRVVFTAWRFQLWMIFDRNGCKRRGVERCLTEAVIALVSEGNGGLFGMGWLYNWRDSLVNIGGLQKAWHYRLAHPESPITYGDKFLFGDMSLFFRDRPLPMGSQENDCCGKCNAFAQLLHSWRERNSSLVGESTNEFGSISVVFKDDSFDTDVAFRPNPMQVSLQVE